jgi:diketogulonate reductase-like aldo/keto reductase
MGRSMAAVAVNWVANRPAVASVIVGATKLRQLEENIAALAFEMPSELRVRLDAASTPERTFPYTFFGSEIQGMIHGGVTVGDKPPGYFPSVAIFGGGSGVT